MDHEIKLIDEKVKAQSEFVERINKAMAGTIIGQKNIIERLLIARQSHAANGFTGAAPPAAFPPVLTRGRRSAARTS